MQAVAGQVTRPGVALIAAAYLDVWQRAGAVEAFGAVKTRLDSRCPVRFLALAAAGTRASAARASAETLAERP